MLIEKLDIPQVAMEFMNDVHSEDCDIINNIFELILKYEKEPTSENKNNINEKYNYWIKHTIEHFKNEEIQMQEKNFPPYMFHKGEHDNALALMNSTFDKWKETDDILVLKSYFIEVLPEWFNKHISSMDTVTGMFLKTGLSPCGSR